MAVTKTVDRRWTVEITQFVARWNRELNILKEEVEKHQRFAMDLTEACRKTVALLAKAQEEMKNEKQDLLKSAPTAEKPAKAR